MLIVQVNFLIVTSGNFLFYFRNIHCVSIKYNQRQIHLEEYGEMLRQGDTNLQR